MFLEVSKRLPRHGVKLYCVVPKLSLDVLKMEGLDCQFFILPVFKFEYKSYRETGIDMLKMWFVFIYRTIYGCFKVLRWLRWSRAAVIYSTGDFIPDTIPPAFAKLFGKRFKWIMLVHHIIESPRKRKTGSFISNTGSYLMQRFSFFLIEYFADGVFVKNTDVKNYLVQVGFNKEKIFIIDNGIDIDRINYMPEDYAMPFDACYIGRLSASKGITDLIKAWSLVVKIMPEARLAIIGGGSVILEEEKREEIRELGLDGNIRILGSLPDEEAYRVRKNSRISVSCSYEEGWGITIAESLACGIPCVVYDLPVYAEKFDGAIETAPRGDVETFAAKITMLLKDAERRKNMGRKGKQLVQRYNIEDIVLQEVSIIRRIVGESFEVAS